MTGVGEVARGGIGGCCQGWAAGWAPGASRLRIR